MNISRVLRSTIIFVTIALTTSVVIFAGDPVPGLDVSIEQIPGGIVRVVKSDKLGRFSFEKLKPGKYVVKLVPKKVENHNSSRSNKAQIRQIDNTNYELTITLFKTGKKQPFVPIEVIIGPKGGSISGHIVLESVMVRGKT